MQSTIEKYLNELYDYNKNHGHDRTEVGSILWHFHNYEHGYKHCKGGEINAYKIEHYNEIHIINKQYARGHGIKREPQWFKFIEEIKPNWWEVESGAEVSLDQVPIEFKRRE